MALNAFADFGIEAPSAYNSAGDGYTLCPQCSASRRKRTVKCLSVNEEKQTWHCHHCGWSGSLRAGEQQKPIKPKLIRKPVYPALTTLSEAAIAVCAWRKIPLALLIAERIGSIDAYMPSEEEFIPCLTFPYLKQSEVVNVKYRGVSTKTFRQEGNAEKVFYRQDAIRPDAVVVITEGEFDALSCVLAGYPASISVPDGAPSPTAKAYASKFEFLDQTPDPLANVEQIILAVDADPPGETLREELARRLGRDRCYTVTWPNGCKDANEVLVRFDVAALKYCLDAAKPWPVEDEMTVIDLAEATVMVAQRGLPPGLSTGWPALDAIFTVIPGQLTIVTGIPSHGKSMFVDALAVNLMQQHGWRFVICSPENHPPELHMVELMEKWTNKTVRSVPPWGTAVRMTTSDMGPALEDMNQAFSLIVPTDAMTIPALLDRVTRLVKRRGVQGLIIDPYNEFDHQRGRGQTEAEYISDLLGAIRRWARQWSVHVFVVAHPRLMPKREDGTYDVPTPYDINGGAAWRNKADNCLAVWRDFNAA